jgi:hypothetical protein
LQSVLVFRHHKTPGQTLRTLDIGLAVSLFAFVMASKGRFPGSSVGSKRETEIIGNGNGNGY